MRYEPAKASLYIKNRAKVANKLPSNSLAVLNSNDIMPQYKTILERKSIMTLY